MGWRAGGSEEWVARRVRAARDGGGGQSGSEGWGRGLGVRGVRGMGAEGWGRGCGWWGVESWEAAGMGAGMLGGRCGGARWRLRGGGDASAEGLRGGGCGVEGLRGGRCGWEGGAIASWRVRGWDLWGAGAVMGTAGRRRGWDGWPGQRLVDVGGVRREEGVSGGWWMWWGE